MHRGTEVKAWPLTARPLPLWPRGPRRLRLNSGRRGSRAQALVAAGGPAGGDVERSRAFLGSNTVPAPAGLFHRGDTHFCSDKQGRSCCVLWLDGKCSNSKTGPSTGKHGACRPVETSLRWSHSRQESGKTGRAAEMLRGQLGGTSSVSVAWECRSPEMSGGP